MTRHLFEKNVKYGIVAHDAGAANILISWLPLLGETGFLVYLDGPALGSLPADFLPFQANSLDDLVTKADVVLTGTGWASDLEYNAIRKSKEQKVHVISLIDHWINYRARFIRDGNSVMPNEIWVTDKYALELARDRFRDIPVTIKPNLYLENQLERARSYIENNPPELLYVSSGGDSKDEILSLEYTVSHLPQLGISQSTKITIRPHPSEVATIYQKWIVGNSYRLNCSVGHKEELSAMIGRSHWIVGRETMPLVVGALAGKKVLSSLAPDMGPLRLPHREILEIRKLLSK